MPWVLAMDWVDAMFLHWPVDRAALRARIPADLEIGTFDGSAWVSVVAFRIAGARLRGVPRGLAWPAFPEVNVRTYVSGGGHDGVWFFSLDAGSRWAVEGGRRGIHLPYYRAMIASSFGPGGASYRLARTHPGAPVARLTAQAAGSGDAHPAAAGTLEHWLAERYCFFTADPRGRTRRGDVLHEPWPLRAATVRIEENSLLSAAGIEPSRAQCLAHVSSGVSTRAWPLR
jgi:uncharacterized protein YqjF (DUF2071 family)